MNPAEILEQIKKLKNSIDKSILELENSDNTGFHINSLKKKTIELYDHLESLTELPALPREKKIEFVEKPIEVKEDIKTEIITPPVLPEIKVKQEIIAEVKEVQKKHEEITYKTVKIAMHQQEEDENDDISINEKISKSKQPVINYADKSKETSIKDLSKAISISKKFEFISGLFDNNSEAYKQCVNTVQNAASYDDAVSYIESNAGETYSWDENEKLASEFFGLVRRRFQS